MRRKRHGRLAIFAALCVAVIAACSSFGGSSTRDPVDDGGGSEAATDSSLPRDAADAADAADAFVFVPSASCPDGGSLLAFDKFFAGSAKWRTVYYAADTDEGGVSVSDGGLTLVRSKGHGIIYELAAPLAVAPFNSVDISFDVDVLAIGDKTVFAQVQNQPAGTDDLIRLYVTGGNILTQVKNNGAPLTEGASNPIPSNNFRARLILNYEGSTVRVELGAQSSAFDLIIEKSPLTVQLLSFVDPPSANPNPSTVKFGNFVVCGNL